MLGRRRDNAIAGRVVPIAAQARRVRAVLAVIAVASILAAAAYILWTPSLPAPSPVPSQDKPQTQTSPPADRSEPSLLGYTPVIGALRGTDDARTAAPSIIFMVGRPDSNSAPDLSTPAQAVHSVLALLDGGNTEALSQCFCDGEPNATEGLYPHRLGPPIELLEVLQEGETARVRWNATVHTAFSLEGESWSPGETVGLETHLVQVDGAWKLTRLHEHSP